MENTYFNLYKLRELFEIKSPTVTPKISIEQSSTGLYPYVTGQSVNNGVEFFCDEYTENGNVITVDRITYSFIGYQEKNFSCNDNVKILKPKFDLNRNRAFYICTILKNEKYRYNYGRITSKERLEETNLRLPSKKNGDIDWNFIDNYVDGIYKVISNRVSNKAVSKDKLVLGAKSWKEFSLNELFCIIGSRTTSILDLQEHGKGLYPFVTTQATNNGVENFYNYFTEKGNVLTMDSAVIGYCSFQPIDFSASDHVEKLIPKFQMDKYIALFLTTIMNKERYRYNYGRKASQARLKQRSIRLPITANKEPDWDFMKNYIRSLPYSANL